MAIEPHLLELAPGEYRWCACGRTRTPPFCDESHYGTGVEPVRFTIRARRTVQTVWLCSCRNTRTPPFCDGSHNKRPPKPPAPVV